MHDPTPIRGVLLVCLYLALTALVGCGNDGPKDPPQPPINDGNDVEVAPSDLAQAAFMEIEPANITLAEAIARFDVNGDGVLDPLDTRDMALCMDAEEAIDGMRCDLVADGEIDAQDGYLLGFALGEARAVPSERLEEAADTLLQIEDEEDKEDLDLTLSFRDYNEDGAVDRDDIALFAELLRDDPNGRFDRDGDGLLSLRDIRMLTDEYGDELYNGPVATPDVNGQGGVTAIDLLILAHATLYTVETKPGLLDVNLDGAIDAHDYCMVSDRPADGGVYGLFMLEEDAAQAHAAQPPRLELCRADNKPIARQAMRLDTPLTVTFKPSNLYIEAVDALPEGYDLWDPSKAEGLSLFAVTTRQTDRPLTAISMPWASGIGSTDSSTFEIGGEALPADAGLLLPDTVIPMTETPESALRDSSQGTANRTRVFTTSIDDRDFGPGQKASAKAFTARLQETIALYNNAINGDCLCAMSDADRAALVSNILRVSQGLDAILAVSATVLETFFLKKDKLLRNVKITGAEAAAHQDFVAGEFVTVEVAKLLVDVADIVFAGIEGGLLNAFQEALGKLIAEVALDSQASDESDGIGVDRGRIATSAAASTAAGTLTERVLNAALSKLIERHNLLKDSAETIGPAIFKKIFTEEFVRKQIVAKVVSQDGLAKSVSISVIRSIITELLKLGPVLYLEYQLAIATQKGLLAEEALQDLAGLRATTKGQVNAFREIQAGKERIDTLKTALLAKLEADGCPVEARLVDPCSFELEVAIDSARAQFVQEVMQTRNVFDDLIEQSGPGAIFESNCVDGEVQRTFNEKNLQVVGIARELAQIARLGGSAKAIEALNARLTIAIEELGAAKRAITTSAGGVCAQILGGNFTGERIEALAQSEEDRAAAFRTFQAAVEAALATYDACRAGNGESASACDADLTLAKDNPWAAAEKVLSCLPNTPLECCGDNTLGPGEACDDGNRIDGDGCSSFCELEGEMMQDAFEPNDTPETATTIPAEGDNPYHPVEAELSPLALTEGDEDHFKMTVCPEGLIGLLLTKTTPDGSLEPVRVRVNGAPDTLEILSDNPGPDAITQEIRNTATTPTEIDIQISREGVLLPDATPYLLFVDLYCPRDEDEDTDDVRQVGNPVSDGARNSVQNHTLQQGDSDWRRIDVCPNGIMDVVLERGSRFDQFSDVEGVKLQLFRVGQQAAIIDDTFPAQEQTIDFQLNNPEPRAPTSYVINVEIEGDPHHFLPYSLTFSERCPPPPEDENCSDDIDNDLDGDTDCDDSDCAQDADCEPPVEICADGEGNPPNGYTEVMFGGFNPLLSGVVCIQDTCGNFLDPDHGIRDISPGFSGADLRTPFVTQPWRIPAGIPVVAGGIFSNNFFGQGDDRFDCDSTEFDSEPIEFVTPPDDDGKPRLFLVDSAGGTHLFDSDCPEGPGPFVRLINISPEVPIARIKFSDLVPDPVPEDLFGGIVFGEASDWLDISRLLYEGEQRVLGNWGYHDGNAEMPFQNLLYLGGSKVSVASTPQVGSCHSIIFWQNPSNGLRDDTLLTVEDPPLCEPWFNNNGEDAPRNVWDPVTGCTFPDPP